jgi:hypothetical protein
MLENSPVTLDKNLKLDTPANSEQAIGLINTIYTQLYDQRRRDIIHMLRQIPSFVETARNLTAGKSYRVVIPEIGGVLGISSAGGYTPNLHGLDGKTIGQARLEKMPLDLSTALGQMSNQQAFAEILQRLEAIDQRINDVLTGLHLDRISRVNAGINLYHQAILAKEENRPRQLNSAITELQKGLDFLLNELRSELAYIDGLPSGLWGMVRSFPTPHVKVDKKIQPMQETYQAMLRAAYFLPISHEVLGNTQSQELCLRQLRSITDEFNVKLGGIVCWLKESDKALLLDTWGASKQIASAIVEPSRLLGSGKPQEIGVQFTPTEITSED